MEISLTRALAELKTLDARLSALVRETGYVGIKQGDENPTVVLPTGGATVQEIEAAIISLNDRYISLMARRRQIRAKMAEANNTTYVKFGNETLTINQLLDLRNFEVDIREARLAAAKQQYVAHSTRLAKLDQDALRAIEAGVTETLSKMPGVTSAELPAATENLRSSLINNYVARSRQSLIDPLKIGEEIRKEEDALADLKMNIDFTLSEVNAKTFIEVD